MRTVFVASFRSSGEHWNTKVFKNVDSAAKYMLTNGWNCIDCKGYTFLEYQDSKDKTQTATISELKVIE